MTAAGDEALFAAASAGAATEHHFKPIRAEDRARFTAGIARTREQCLVTRRKE